MNRLIASNGEFMCARRDENQHRVALARLVHTEPMKLLLRCNEGFPLQLAALHKNANLTGRFGFRLANCLNDLVVLKLGEEFSRSHFVSPTRSRAASAETAAATTESAEAATTVTSSGGPTAATWDEDRATSSR
jgi:hypothetical protein